MTAEVASFDYLQSALAWVTIQSATARTQLRDLNRFLQDDFAAGLELLKDTHAAYQALREAM